MKTSFGLPKKPCPRLGALPAIAMLMLVSGCSDDPVDDQPRDEGRAVSAAHEHGPHEAEGGADDHGEHGHHEEQSEIRLSDEQLAEFGIELRDAQAGRVSMTVSLPGEVVFDPDHMAHVTPRVPGVVREVIRRVGDRVETGDTLAVLDSRELAQAQSAYLAARAKLDLAQSNFEREQRLFEREIAPEAEFLQARQALREAEVDLRLAERELHALGLDERQVTELPEGAEEELTRYALRAPIDGTIIERRMTQGEVIPAQPTEPPFVIANPDPVWVQLTVYPRNLGQVRPGQTVTVAAENASDSTTGTIDYVSPQLRESTRTGTARVVLENPDGVWRPGQFVTGRVHVEQVEARIVVPESAIQTLEGESVVFVQTDEGFEPRPVEIGRRGEGRVAILSGLEPGQQYAATNTFTLKAELGRGELEHGHAH